MGIDDLLGDFGDDLGKAKDLADQLWDDRDKISETVSLVWENKDELNGVLDFVRDHGDDLLDLLRKVPDILGQAGDGLSMAGSSAVQAGGWDCSLSVGRWLKRCNRPRRAFLGLRRLMKRS